MADLNAILDSIKELKLLEVAELVKMMEEEFGVSAAAPVVVAGAAEGGAAAADEKSEFDVVLADAVWLCFADEVLADVYSIHAVSSSVSTYVYNEVW